MIKTLTTGGSLAVLVVLGQTNLLRFLEIRSVQPDIALVIIVFMAYYHGSLFGESVGFVSGLTEDMLSLAPPGFNALIRTVVGYASGLTQNQMVLDPIFMPMLLVVGATIVKLLMLFLVGSLFSVPGAVSPVPLGSVLIELLYTAILGPIVFALLRLVPLLQPEKRL